MTNDHPFAPRLQHLQLQIPENEAWLIANPADIHYLTGFRSLVPEEREAFLILTRQTQMLAHAHFSPPPPSMAGLALSNSVTSSALVQLFKELAKKKPFTTLCADLRSLHADEYQALQAGGLNPHALDRQILANQKMCKDQSEIASLTEAGQVAAKAFSALRNELVEGMSERAVARRLEVLMLELGSERPAFPTIVAFGDHGALPHHQPSDRMLTNNTPLLIDFGATVDGYRSDMTRSWWFGAEADHSFLEVEQVVQTSYNLALAASRLLGQSVAEIDRAARNHISQAGYGQYFIHTTGHGVGLEIHEAPSIYHTQTQILQAGMIITIEPGIYVPGKFGYRHENTVHIGENETTELTKETGVQ